MMFKIPQDSVSIKFEKHEISRQYEKKITGLT